MPGCLRILFVAVLAAALAGGAAAAPATLSAQAAADEKIVREVWAAGTFEVTARRHDALLKVLDHAPAHYPSVEQISPTVTVVRAQDSSEAMALMLVAAAGAKGAHMEVVEEFNIYPTAAFLLGSEAVEKNRPQEALVFLDRGLALQPDNPILLNEKAAAFEALHQPAQALATLEPWLSTEHIGAERTRARLLRGKGFALTELDRLDEAEAAYNESLKAEPGHPGAQAELKYIAGIRSGQARGAVGLQTSDKALAGEPVKPLPPPGQPNP